MKAREREREKDAFDGALGELENGGDEWRICCFLPGGGTGGGGHGVAEYVPTPGERVRLLYKVIPEFKFMQNRT